MGVISVSCRVYYVMSILGCISVLMTGDSSELSLSVSVVYWEGFCVCGECFGVARYVVVSLWGISVGELTLYCGLSARPGLGDLQMVEGGLGCIPRRRIERLRVVMLPL